MTVRIRSISVENYRSFKNIELSFAEPINDQVGSGLTVITGANNSGKTSLLEALTMQPTSSIPQGQRHGDSPPVIKIGDI